MRDTGSRTEADAGAWERHLHSEPAERPSICDLAEWPEVCDDEPLPDDDLIPAEWTRP